MYRSQGQGRGRGPFLPGGGIAKIVNAIEINTHDKVVIAGGTNEIVHVEDNNELVYTIDKSLEKLK